MKPQSNRRVAFLRPLYFLIAFVVVVAVVVADVAYRRANPPPIQFRSDHPTMRYSWTAKIACDGVQTKTVEFRGEGYGSDVQTIPWPTGCERDRVLLDVYYRPGSVPCREGNDGNYLVKGGPPLVVRFDCHPFGMKML